ncbi:hypothetical protein [Microbacterium candidum]|uniref:Uncharacterized protein n=1 Tax=Microbacterium candidum TaxID=3041922 RepID=A0ABT7MW13_9MICO|nr:hypothetical protein [Microbacterium sp. ASV49]MDL9978641.1 hypothetical protein [Microbacterium sp. ASV49]
MPLFGRKPAEHSATGYDNWRDPHVEPATTDWERRVNAFASKSARALLSAGVPLFRSQWARDGKDTYQEAFWLVAVDGDFANRPYVKFSPGKSGGSNPPSRGQGDYVGFLRGSALLLTKSGVLCGADVEGFITPAGRVDGRCMDMLFHNVRRDTYILSGSDGWGWYNQGRWRSDPRSNLRVYGVDAHVDSIRFDSRYRRNNEPDPGYGTSAALSSFVKNGGATRWPRHFITFDY